MALINKIYFIATRRNYIASIIYVQLLACVLFARVPHEFPTYQPNLVVWHVSCRAISIVT